MKIQFTLLLFTVSFHCLVAQGTWKQKAAFPGNPRDGAVCFTIGNKAYVGPDGTNNDLWEYDPSTDKWTRKADFPDNTSERQWAAGFAIGDKGYIGTGSGNFGMVMSDFWEYDPRTDAWTRRGDLPGAPRAYAVGFAAGGKGYITAGLDYESDTPYLLEYDPVADKWTDRGIFPGGVRCFASACVIGSKAYVGLGYNSGERKDFWELDPDSSKWVRKSDFGAGPRSGAVGFTLGTSLYLGLGSSEKVQNDFWTWDPATNWWSRQANFPGSARSGAVAFAIGNKGYMGLGGGNTDIWEFTPGPGEEQRTGQSGMQIYSYPGSSKINVVYNAVTNTRVTLTVKDAGGRLIYSENTRPADGFYKTVVDLKYNPRGEYLAEIFDGEQRFSKKITLK
jgi:N-acetylneuraminic acid mutarotase